MPHACLALEALEFMLHLGVAKEEQSQPQLIRVSIEIGYEALPESCVNDSIDDADCYATLAERIESVCRIKIYHLLEHLAHSIYQDLKTRLPSSSHVSVMVEKCNPPIPASKGPASFTIAD